MKFNYKLILKDTSFYGILLSLNKLPDVILLGLLIKYLSKEEFAVYGLLLIIKVIITSIVGLGLDIALPRFVVDIKYKRKLNSVFTNIFSAILGCIIFIIPFILFFKNNIFHFYNISEKYGLYLKFLVLWALVSCFNNFVQIWFRWTNEKTKLIYVSILNVFFTVIFSLIFIHVLKLGLRGVFYAVLISESIVFLVAAFFLAKRVKKKLVSIHLLKELVQYSFPFMIVLMVGTILPSVDRLFLTHHISKTTLSVYLFAYRIAILYNLLLYALQFGFQPLIYSDIGNVKDNLDIIKKYQTSFVILINAGALLFIAVSKIFIVIFAKEGYEQAATYLPYLVFSSMVYSLQLFASLGVFLAKKSYATLLAIISGLAICILFNSLLTPKLLEKGAYLSLIIGNIFVISILYAMSAKYLKLFLNIKIDFLIIMLSLPCLILLSQTWVNINLWLDALVKSATVFFVFFLVFIAWKLKLKPKANI